MILLKKIEDNPKLSAGVSILVVVALLVKFFGIRRNQRDQIYQPGTSFLILQASHDHLKTTKESFKIQTTTIGK